MVMMKLQVGVVDCKTMAGMVGGKWGRRVVLVVFDWYYPGQTLTRVNMGVDWAWVDWVCFGPKVD